MQIPLGKLKMQYEEKTKTNSKRKSNRHSVPNLQKIKRNKRKRMVQQVRKSQAEPSFFFYYV